MIGEVLSGANNIYRVRLLEGEDGRVLLCRIRGKVLRSQQRTHNPIAVGDLVTVAAGPHGRDEGWILERRPRRSAVVRYNKKSRSPQVVAANVDLLVCVTSVRQPPFRPRFLDRLLVAAHAGGVQPIVFANKIDLGVEPETERRLENYEKLGYTVIRGSARTGRGLEALSGLLQGRTSVFMGQSGVGKSSLLNRLDPSLGLKVGEVSRKYDRGSHTTSAAVMVDVAGAARVIDTPGIRELDLCGLAPADLAAYYPEFAPYSGSCQFNSCTHTSEEGCAVRAAVAEGSIHADRYESYLRLWCELQGFERSPHA